MISRKTPFHRCGYFINFFGGAFNQFNGMRIFSLDMFNHNRR